ncbi:MAG: hypothetical protein OEZ38_02880 [Gammaproteobacteria bacterium]|nr:hypothetical protein [Gammaproteobacteria bacterium]
MNTRQLSMGTKLIVGAVLVLVPVVAGVVTALIMDSDTDEQTVAEVSVKQAKSEATTAKKELSPQEMDDLQSSWLFSGSESASLVDEDNGLETATIGR